MDFLSAIMQALHLSLLQNFNLMTASFLLIFASIHSFAALTGSIATGEKDLADAATMRRPRARVVTS